MKTIEPKSEATITETFPPSSISAWHHRHILDLDDFSRDEIELVFEIADAMADQL
jgi:hypothetical protein